MNLTLVPRCITVDRAAAHLWCGEKALGRHLEELVNVSKLQAQSRLLAEDGASKTWCVLLLQRRFESPVHLSVSPGCSLTGACRRLLEPEHCWGSRMALWGGPSWKQAHLGTGRGMSREAVPISRTPAGGHAQLQTADPCFPPVLQQMVASQAWAA